MYFLTSGAVTELGVQWLLPTQLIPYLPAMTAALIADVKVGIIFMDLVWCSKLPLVELSLCASVVPIVTICPIC